MFNQKISCLLGSESHILNQYLAVIKRAEINVSSITFLGQVLFGVRLILSDTVSRSVFSLFAVSFRRPLMQ